jgi:hypothetical protein
MPKYETSAKAAIIAKRRGLLPSASPDGPTSSEAITSAAAATGQGRNSPVPIARRKTPDSGPPPAARTVSASAAMIAPSAAVARAPSASASAPPSSETK